MLGGLVGLAFLISLLFIGPKLYALSTDPRGQAWLVIGGIVFIGVLLGMLGVQPGSWEPSCCQHLSTHGAKRRSFFAPGVTRGNEKANKINAGVTDVDVYTERVSGSNPSPPPNKSNA